MTGMSGQGFCWKEFGGVVSKQDQESKIFGQYPCGFGDMSLVQFIRLLSIYESLTWKMELSFLMIVTNFDI